MDTFRYHVRMLETIPAVFDHTLARHPDKTALVRKREGRWEPISYAQFYHDAERVTARLIDLGIAKGDRVAILSENRPEWVMSDQGILAAAAVDVPIYPTLSAPQIRYVLDNCGAKAILLSRDVHLNKVLEIAADLPELRHVVVFDEAAAAAAPEVDRLTVVGWSEFIAAGDRLLESTADERKRRKDQLAADDLASLIYTSGTTGDPKGVMLTHRNLVSNHQTILPLISLVSEDSCLSFLPLSHVFERVAYNAFVAAGATIYYAENIDALAANLLEVKPTVLVSVPRVFEKIRARAYDAMAKTGGIKARLFDWAMEAGRRALVDRETFGSLPPIQAIQRLLADRLVFGKIRERTGGNLRVAVCGGAPLSRPVAEFFEIVGITLLEGYGMTESSPVIACNVPDARRLGTVGRPIPGVEVSIGDDGEILCRGPNVMQGYFNMPDATQQAIDGDGWLHTGDIGEFDGDGFLKITDRKKEILVMSNGKNVAPAPIENGLITSRFIAQAVVIGDNRNFISALIVPNFESLEHWAHAEGLLPPATSGDPVDRPSLIQNPKVKALIRSEIDHHSADLAKFETIKEFALLPAELTQENGELTPTLKFKRRVILERYRDLIDAIYAPGAAARS